MLAVLCGKVGSLFVVATLSTHRDGRVQIKLQITRRLDEFLKLLYIFELCITIEKKGGMIRCSFMMLVEFFEVFN
jgi:hypothetical protein